MSTSTNPTPRSIVPKELAGKWIAWNSAGGAIIANGASLAAVMSEAQRLGESNASFEKVPPADARLVGIAR
jgi:hypothetical protein